MKKSALGLTLSGGGTLGGAYVGVINAMNEYGLKPDIISGTSIGAIVGAFYAAGYGPEVIREFFKKIKLPFSLAWSLSRKGLLDLSFLKMQLARYLPEKFSALEIPLYVGVTNLNKPGFEVVHEGPLLDWLIASSSIPMIFKPVSIDGNTYVDGGVINNLPVSAIRHKCERLIAIDLRPVEVMESHAFKNAFSVVTRVISINIRKKVQDERILADLVIDMEGINQWNMLRLNHLEALEAFGYEKAMYALKESKFV